MLTELFLIRGVPVHIRSDNGGEFIAAAIRRVAEITGLELLYIAPASPWENGFAESFHSRLRDELLDAEVFADVREAKALAAAWKNEYNHRRPHSSLGYVPPAVYAARLAATPVVHESEKEGSHSLGTPPPRARPAMCSMPSGAAGEGATSPNPSPSMSPGPGYNSNTDTDRDTKTETEIHTLTRPS